MRVVSVRVDRELREKMLRYKEGGLGSRLSMLLFLVFGFLHGFCCVGWYLMSTQ